MNDPNLEMEKKTMRRILMWRGWGGGEDHTKKERCVGINHPNLKAAIFTVLNDHVICLDHELDCFLSDLY